MLLSAWDSTSSYLQLIGMLAVFVFVLCLTLFATRWIAKNEKKKYINRNIEVLESSRITANAYIQIVRIGETYAAIAVCKDSVTMLASIPKEQIEFKNTDESASFDFKELFDKAAKKISGKEQKPYNK